MRNLNANALTKIATIKGTEPVIIIEVNWHGADNVSYADKAINGIPGKILDMSGLDAIININGSSNTQEINLTLDDIDGTIKTIIDNHDVHLRDVWVYQWFEGLDLDDRFLLFRGKINSPIVWREGSRALEFSVVSNIESNEIGYSIEEGNFIDMPIGLIGKAWPMCFGTTIYTQALRLTERVKGILVDGLSFPDFGLASRNTSLTAIRFVSIAKNDAVDDPTGSFSITFAQCYDQRSSQINDVQRILTEQDATNQQPRIMNSTEFPQGIPIYIRIGNVTFYGKITENVFTFVGNYQHPNLGDFHYPNFTDLDNARMLYDGKTYTSKTLPQATRTCGRSGFNTTGTVNGDNAGYVYIGPGAAVSISEPEPQTYVVSIIPGTVLRVSAWASKDGQRFIQNIDPADYRVYTEDYGDLTMTFIELNDALSKRTNFNWSDDLYVIFESSIGPNTVDILQYIIETYSDFNIDATSFDHVREILEDYPSHFTLYDRKELFKVLNEIAWQSRCAIWLKDNTFFIKYLAEEPTPIDTITESDIEINSLVLEHTPTEDLVTKMVCSWRESGLQENAYATILRHNIPQYGTHEKKYDFYIYNTPGSVIKSAAFWLIRYANTWKKLKFTVPLTKLNVETFDAVTLDFTSNYIANTDVIVSVTSAAYNSVDNNIEMTCWTPVRAGTMEPYIFAYPTVVDDTLTFPEVWNVQEGFIESNSPGRDETVRPGWGGSGGGTGVSSGGGGYGGGRGSSYNICADFPQLGICGSRPWWEEAYQDMYLDDLYGPNKAYTSPLGYDTPVGFPDPGPESPSPEGVPDDPLDGIPAVAGPDDPNNLPSPDSVLDNPCNVKVWVHWNVNITVVTAPCEGAWTIDEVNDGIMTRPGTTGRSGTGSGEVEVETLIFNTCEAALAFLQSMREYILGCIKTVGQPSPGLVLMDRAEHCNDVVCENPIQTDRSDGMIGYDAAPGQTPFNDGYGGWAS